MSENNAGGETVVTAPTCGACGIVPGVLYFLRHHTDDVTDEDVIDALAVAGVIGNITKVNASISGAEAGCQAEVGTACAMAAGAATFLMGGSTEQIEYAASMAIEHMLGLTCDPVKGLVQVPCIERNAMAAGRALECAQYALMTSTFHIISFDEVIMTMILTGEDIEDSLRETSKAGLAQTYNLDELARIYLECFGITAGSAPAAVPQPQPAQQETPENFGGTYRCTVDCLRVRDAPGLGGTEVAHYSSGETVTLDNWYKIADGFVWGRYTGYSGATRYIAVGKATGKPEADDYLVKVG